MNVWSVAAMGIGSMVGAGIFALLGQAALVAGANTYLAFLIGGGIALLSGYSFSKLAARYPKAGGVTEYFDEGFGKGALAGTFSLIYLITLIVSVAMVAKAFGAYAAGLCGASSDRIAIDGFASASVVGFFVLNLCRSKMVGRAELLLVVFKLVVLVVLVVAGAETLSGHIAAGHIRPSAFALIASVGLTFFAYAGYGTMTNAAESVTRPQRTIPHAIYLAITLVIVLYVALAIVVLANIAPAELARNADTAVAAAAEPVLGKGGFVAVSLAALASTASSINASWFSAMRVTRSLAEAGQLPRSSMRIVRRLASSGDLFGLCSILVMTNFMKLNAIANLAGAIFLVVYLAVHVVAWRLAADIRASRKLVALGFLSMASVLIVFLVTMAQSQAWLLALTVLFVAASALMQILVAQKVRR
jgi:amino acid transporter